MNEKKPQKSLVLLASTAVALLAACVLLGLALRRRAAGAQLSPSALGEEDVRAAVVAELVARNKGIFDSHPDPDVGRVLQPGLVEAEFMDVPVSSNAWGMRERAWARPKPEGTLRIVFLGDSFVFGSSLEAEERMGAFLETYLRERGVTPGKAGREVECLHLGVGSWNAVAEAEFARRQLEELRPDLVVQLLIQNDLDDNNGVRGFGAPTNDPASARERCGSRVYLDYPSQFGRTAARNFLLEGVDWESRQRYARIAERLQRLARSVEAYGGRYLLVARWPDAAPKLHRHVGSHFEDEQLLYLPRELSEDPELWVDAADPHWNRRGNALFAQTLYGVIRARGLLGLEPAPWPKIEEEARRRAQRGWREATDERPRAFWGSRRKVAPTLRFPTREPSDLQQLYTGIDPTGRANSYASLILAQAGNTLSVQGRALDRHELTGATLTILIDAEPVGTVELEVGQPFRATFPLPESNANDPTHRTVRFQTDDWILTGDESRACVSFFLERVTIGS